MTIIGSAYVDIRAITSKLEGDIKSALGSLPDEFTILVDADVSQLKDKIDKAVGETSDSITIDLDVDVSEATSKIDDLVSDAEGDPIDIIVDADTSAASKELATLYEDIVDIDIVVDADVEPAQKAIEALVNHSELERITIDVNTDTSEALKQIEALSTDASEHPINIPVDADTAAARGGVWAFLAEMKAMAASIALSINTAPAKAQLYAFDIMNLDKVIEYRIEIKKKSIDGAKATAGAFFNYMNQLSGMQVLGGMTKEIIDFKRHIGELTPGLAITGLTIGSVTMAITGLLGGILSLGSSLTTLLGVAWAAPGIFAGWAISMAVTTVALKDIGKQVPEITNQFKLMAAEIRGDFWGEAREGFEDFAGSLPEFRKQLSGTSKALGSFWGALAGAVDSDDNLAWTAGMFDSLAESITIGERAAKPFVDSIMTLGVVGSAYLPRLATWMVKLVEQFDKFTSVNMMNGNLDKWIERGIEGFKDLGGIIFQTTRIFSGLSQAATDAGGPTLDTLNLRLKNIADTIAMPQFQDTLTTFFRGANEGIGNFTSHLGSLGDALTVLAPTFETVFGLIGDTVGKAVDLVSIAVSRPAFSEGLIGFFEGVKDGIDALEPAMGPIGDKFGVFADFVGELARQLGPVLATAAVELLPVLSELFEEIKPLIKPLADLTIVIIKELAPAISTIVREVIPPFVALLKDDLIPVAKDIAEVVGPALVGAVKTIGWIFDQIKPQVEGGTEALEKSSVAVKENESIFGQFKDFMNTPMFTGKTPAQDIEQAGELAGDALKNFGSLEGNQNFWTKLMDDWGWTEGMESFSETVDRDVATLNTNVNQALKDFAGDSARNTEGMFKDIGTNLESAGTEISTSWNGFWTDLGSGTETLNTTVNAQLDSFWTDQKQNVSDFATDAEKNFTTFTTGVGDNWNGFWSKAAEDTAPFRDGMAELGDKVGTAMDKLFGEPLRIAGEANTRHWEKVTGDIQTWATDTGDDIAVWWEKTNEDNRIAQEQQKIDNDLYWAGVNAGWAGMWSDINLKSDEFWGPFNEKAATNWASFTGGLQGMTTDMSNGWNGMWADINLKADEFWGPFNEKASANWASFTGGIQGMATDAGNGWNGMWADINAKADEHWGPINEDATARWAEFNAGVDGLNKDVNAGWNGMWTDISAAVGTWGAEVQAGFEGFTSGLGAAYETGLAILDDIGRNGWGAVARFVGEAWDNISREVQTGIDTAVEWVRSLPQRALDALGNLSGILAQSGRNLIDGFVGGIRDAAAGAGNAVGGALQAIRDFFPHSPAKKGPFSGLGYTSHSGKALVRDMAKGMMGELSTVERAAQNIAAAARPSFSMDGLGGISGLPNLKATSGPSLIAAASVAAIQPVAVAPSGNTIAPVINVYPSAQLDNREVGRMAATELYWQLLNTVPQG